MLSLHLLFVLFVRNSLAFENSWISRSNSVSQPGAEPNGVIHYPQEVHLANVKQLTFGGQNAEAYFSFDDSAISFQATNWGTKCDQIFEWSFSEGAMNEAQAPQLISTGRGKTTCSFFYPDGQRILYASTHLEDTTCPPKPCDNPTDAFIKEVCKKGAYLWPVEPAFDIFVANLTGSIVDRLTNHTGYDAEGVISPTKDRIAFTSIRSGDLELWTMALDGSDKKQITNELGYDGGSFFSPDGSKLIWRASRPKNDTEKEYYQKLLNHSVVSPLQMELFVAKSDGSEKPRQVTNLGQANWSPYWHPSGEKVLFSSNHASHGGFNFNLYLINENGTDLEKITYDPTFDSFPMFSYDGKRLIFASTRNGTNYDINLFIADWVENPEEITTRTTPTPTTPKAKGTTTTTPEATTTTTTKTTPATKTTTTTPEATTTTKTAPTTKSTTTTTPSTTTTTSTATTTAPTTNTTTPATTTKTAETTTKGNVALVGSLINLAIAMVVLVAC